MVLRALLMLCCGLPFSAKAEVRSAELDRAARLVFDQRYEAAARALEVAYRQTGNRREAVLRILELQGVVYAQLGQEGKAKAAFQQLLSLDPKRELTGKYSQRVLQPFGAAQAWASENPPLEMTAEPAAVDANGRVQQLAVKVKNDTLKLARRVRFMVRAESEKWVEQEVELQGPYASAATDSPAIEWWAELLGERQMVLVQVGAQRSPIKEGRLREKEAPAKPNPATKVDPEKKPNPRALEPADPGGAPGVELRVDSTRSTSEGSSGSAALRGAGAVGFALGLAGLAGGTVMGVLWQGSVGTLRQKLDGAARDPQGRVISFEGIPQGSAQSYYLGMTDRIRIQATSANVLWAAGGGLVAVGVLLYLLGRDSGDSGDGAGGFAVAF